MCVCVRGGGGRGEGGSYCCRCCCCCCFGGIVVSGVFIFLLLFHFSISLSLSRNSSRLTRERRSSRKRSATHSYQCVQYCRVFRQWYGCQCPGFLTCALMLMHEIAHGDCTDTVREFVLEVDSTENPLPHRGLEPATVLCLDFSFIYFSTNRPYTD